MIDTDPRNVFELEDQPESVKFEELDDMASEPKWLCDGHEVIWLKREKMANAKHWDSWMESNETRFGRCCCGNLPRMSWREKSGIVSVNGSATSASG